MKILSKKKLKRKGGIFGEYLANVTYAEQTKKPIMSFPRKKHGFNVVVIHERCSNK